MFDNVSSCLNGLYDSFFCKESTDLCIQFNFAYHQCIYLLHLLNLDVFRSVSGKHLVLPCITRKDTYSINDEVYNLVDPFSCTFN